MTRQASKFPNSSRSGLLGSTAASAEDKGDKTRRRPQKTVVITNSDDDLKDKIRFSKNHERLI